MRISAIIPIHNQMDYLADAIESVLVQQYPISQIILVDDGSDESLDEVRANYPDVVYLRQSHQGAAAARNWGARHATEEFLAFLDADDLWMPNKIAKQLELFETTKSEIIFTHIEQFVSPEISCPPPKHLSGPGYCASTMLLKKSTFFKVGEFNTEYKTGEFIEWYLRAKKNNISMALCNSILAKRRIHRSNHSAKVRANRTDYLKILSKNLHEYTYAKLAE